MPNRAGAGGGTRTHTRLFKGPRILSPVRLPFRHTGAFATNRVHLQAVRSSPCNPLYRIKRPTYFLIFAKVPCQRKQPMQQPGIARLKNSPRVRLNHNSTQNASPRIARFAI